MTKPLCSEGCVQAVCAKCVATFQCEHDPCDCDQLCKACSERRTYKHEWEEIDHDIQNALHTAIRAFEKSWESKHWDVVVKYDFSVTKCYDGGSPWRVFRVSEPLKDDGAED